LFEDWKYLPWCLLQHKLSSVAESITNIMERKEENLFKNNILLAAVCCDRQ